MVSQTNSNSTASGTGGFLSPRTSNAERFLCHDVIMHVLYEMTLAARFQTVRGDVHIDGLVQDCSNSSALAMELLQSCTKPSI